jgi:hypothetical protein
MLPRPCGFTSCFSKTILPVQLNFSVESCKIFSVTFPFAERFRLIQVLEFRILGTLKVFRKELVSVVPRNIYIYISIRVGRSGDRIPVGARFSATVQTGPEAHPASCTMGTCSFPGVKCGCSVTLTPYPILVPRSKIE